MPYEKESVARDQDGHDDVIQRITARLRTPVPMALASEFEVRVMAAVRSEAYAHHSHVFARRRSMRAWATGAGLAAALALVIADRIHGRIAAASVAPPVVSVGSPTRALAVASPHALGGRGEPTRWIVRFTFAAPATGKIRHVALAGNFNGWDTSVMPLRPIGHGRWVADVPLPPGRYVYQFVINGKQWVPDPEAPHDASADFGTSNSVITVADGGVT